MGALESFHHGSAASDRQEREQRKPTSSKAGQAPFRYERGAMSELLFYYYVSIEYIMYLTIIY